MFHLFDGKCGFLYLFFSLSIIWGIFRLFMCKLTVSLYCFMLEGDDALNLYLLIFVLSMKVLRRNLVRLISKKDLGC